MSPQTTSDTVEVGEVSLLGKGNQWNYRLTRMLNWSDALVIGVSLLIAQVYKFGSSTTAEVAGPVALNYWTFTVLLGFVWWFALYLWRSRDLRVLGTGGDEFRRIIVASIYVFGILAIVSYVLQLQTARGYVAVALPVGLCLLLVSRWIMRKSLVRRRSRGEFVRRLVIVGSPASVVHLNSTFLANPAAGYLPVAAVLPGFLDRSPTGRELPIPVATVSSSIDIILQQLRAFNADAIAISSGSTLKPRTIRQLGWELQEAGISMIMAPALTDVAGPRIHMQPLSGLPLVHVSTPKLEGRKLVVKRIFDIIGASVLLVVLSPALLAIAVLVKLSSPGPILYSQTRIGVGGETFQMFKFRSMIVDADSQLQALLSAQGTSDKPLFKVENDPRITRIGGVLRRYSLDEFPQLFNVLNGTMSLVGPRPQVEAEVALYGRHDHRRLLVKPGMSGLWQVNGRSNLTWEEAIRWDLYYVENWSLIGDISILFKTFSAVVKKDGAI